MRRSLTILLVGWLLFGSTNLIAQTPLGINYQGIARNADGSPLINQYIGLRVSITSGPDGSNDYTEEHHPETNAFGLFAVVLGQGQSAGSIGDVDWGAGNKWLQIEIDPQDNGNYLLVGTQQMMSVPYALYAANSGKELASGFGVEITNGKINNVLPDQIINLNGTGAATVSGTYPNFNIDVPGGGDDADADPTNEIQTLNKAGTTVTLSNGGGSFLDAVNDADSNPTNEFQTVSKAGNTVTLSDGGGSFTDAVDDADANATNEIQSLSKTGNQLNLSSGGSVNLAGYLDNTDSQNLSSGTSGTNRTINISGGTGATISVADNDNNAGNELQVLTKAGDVVSLSNGGGSFTDAVDDADANASNEIQTLSKTGNNLNLSSGGTVDLTSYLDNTDNQNLGFSASGTNRTLTISGGAATTISVADNDNDSANELITNGSYIANNTLRITDAGGNTNIPLGTLNANLNADSNRLTNVADPVSSGDAMNLGYFETKDATDYAMSIPLSYTSSGAGDVALDLSGFSLDKGGLISGSTIIISEAGVYAVSIQGVSALSAGSDIEISINGTPTPIIKGLNHYMGMYLFDLAAGDQIQIVVKFGSVETVNLQIAAYKI